MFSLFLSFGQGPRESRVNKMCRSVTSETRRWRVSVRCDEHPSINLSLFEISKDH